MNEPPYNLYFKLSPPSAFLREATKVAFWVFIWTLASAIVWSVGITPITFWQGTLADITATHATILTLWFLSITLTSFSRLRRYRKAAALLPRQVYFLIYPWANLCLMSFTIAIAITLKEWGVLIPLKKILLIEAIPFVIELAAGGFAMKVPGVSDFFERFNFVQFKKEFFRGLPLMLGPTLKEDPRKYVMTVVEFQHNFVPFIPPSARATKVVEISPYYRADILDQFQRTLSCSYETSLLLGRAVNKAFKKIGQ